MSVLVFYMVLVLICFWPLPLQMRGVVLGNGGGDGWQAIWNMWWIGQVAQGHYSNPYFTPLLYYGQGAPLYLHDLNPINGLVALLFAPLGGYPFVFNLVLLLWTILAAYGGYLLAYDLTGSQPGSLLAGAIFALAPDRIAHIVGGMIGLVSVWGVPFYVLFLNKAIGDGRRRWLVGAALSLVVNMLSSWYYILFLGLFALCFGPMRLIWPPPSTTRRAVARRLVAVGLVSLLAVAPLALLIILNTSRSATTTIDQAASFSADPLAFLIPSVFHPLVGAAVTPLRLPFSTSLAENNVYLGYSVLALASVGAWYRRSARIWLAMALISVLLALGPVLSFRGQPLSWPDGSPVLLPYALLVNLPIMNIARVPARLSVLVLLCLAVLVAYGVQEITRRLERRHAFLVLGGALLVCAFEYMPISIPRASVPHPPAFYAQLKADSGHYAVLDLPLTNDLNEQGRRMYDQTIHGKGIYGGYISRPIRYSLGELIETKLPAADLKRVLATMGFRYIVLHKAQFSASALGDHEAAFLDLPIISDDEQVRVYQLPPTTGPMVVIEPGSGWYNEEQAQGVRYRWLRSPARIAFISNNATPALLSFRVHNAAHHESTLDIAASEQVIANFQVEAGRQVIVGPLHLAAGVSTTILSIREQNLPASALGATNDPREINLALADLRVVVLKR